MSQATIRGIQANGIIPGPDFVFSRDSTGLVSGSQSFTCRRNDFYGQILQAKFRKGESIASIYPNVPAALNFLQIDTAECQQQPGGLDRIFVTYVGYWQITAEYAERETTYTRNNALEERSTLEHPKFLEDVTSEEDRAAIRKGYDGVAKKSFKSDETTYYIWDTVTDEQIATLYEENTKYWWNKIVEQGWKTYQAAVSEWTKSRSNAGGLSASDIANFGKIDDPPGNPATPTGMVWFMSGATESKTLGSGSSWSITWTTIDDNEKNQKLYGDE